MTRDSLGDQPEIDDTIEALRRRVAAAPQNIDVLVELSDALCERLDNDQTRTLVADDVGEPIELLTAAAELATDADPALRAAILADLGHKLTWRFEILLNDDPSQEDRLDKQLGEAIRCYQQALECVSAADLTTRFFSACPEAVLALCQLLRLRSAAHGNLDDLSAAIACQEQVLAVLPDDDEDRPAVLYDLGLDYATRHDQNSETAAQDMDRAIDCLRQSRSLIGADHPGRPELAVRLGHMLGYRVLANPAESSDEDFTEAISELTLARAAPPETTDPSDAVSVRVRLGLVHACRYLMRGGDSEDHEVARAELNDVLAGWDLPTDQADLCHLTLAQLEAFRAFPAQLRRNPAQLVADGTWFRTAVAHFSTIRSGPGTAGAPSTPGNDRTPGDDSPSTGDEVGSHLDALSESAVADPQLSLLIQGLRASGLVRGGHQPDPAELSDLLGWLDDVATGFSDAGMPTEFTSLQASLRAMILAKTGDPGAVTAAADQLMESLPRLDADHPLRGFTHDLLARLVGGIGQAVAQAGADSPAAVATLERLLTELPDNHPDRVQVLTKASAVLFATMTRNRSAVSFDRLREILRRATESPAPPASGAAAAQSIEPVNDALNHYMLGALNGFQGCLDHDWELLNSGIDLLQKAFGKAPEEHPLRGWINVALSTMLYGRALLGGGLENYDAAGVYGEHAAASVAEEEAPPAGSERQSSAQAFGEYLAAAATLARHQHTLDNQLLSDAVERMTAARRLLDDPELAGLIGENIEDLRLLQHAWRLRTHGSGNPGTAAEKAFQASMDTVLTRLADIPAGRFTRWLDTGIAAMALIGHSVVTRDVRELDRGISLLGQACEAPEPSTSERLRALGCLGFGLRWRYELLRDPRDLTNAIERLTQAELVIGQDPPGRADAAGILNLLADCYHERADPHRRDRHRATRTGLAGLRERATDVLLQNTSERAFLTAAGVQSEAAEVARWCLDADQGADAVRALELGRAIVLHATVTETQIPELLRAAGHPELADEWDRSVRRSPDTARLPWDLGPDAQHAGTDRRARMASEMMASLGGPVIPGDLRRRVLRVLEGSPAYSRLLDPPAVGDIADALAATASAALVYLLPTEDRQAGLALVVWQDGRVQPVRLSALRCDPGTPFDAFRQALRTLRAATPGSPDEEDAAAPQARHSWTRQVNDVCDWAWNSAVAQLLRLFPRGAGQRPPRLVLVPVGELGIVPWHAARHPTGPSGAWRYACQDAMFSYASSARQFVDAARRHALPWQSDPAVVRVGGLFWATQETETIHRLFYPDGTYLGAPGAPGAPRDGRGGPDRSRAANRATASRVGELLPSTSSAGSSLLHLGCHAAVADPPLDSFLLLAGGSKLYVRDMLEQARDRPTQVGGGLVILAACASDLTGGGLPDEALTLATAFLAAGSVGVLGARWPVDDVPTALFMMMFHHYLNSGYPDPATALRATQRWMLDRQRTLPPGIADHRLADELGQLDLTEPANWAAFTYQGQ